MFYFVHLVIELSVVLCTCVCVVLWYGSLYLVFVVGFLIVSLIDKNRTYIVKSYRVVH